MKNYQSNKKSFYNIIYLKSEYIIFLKLYEVTCKSRVMTIFMRTNCAQLYTFCAFCTHFAMTVGGSYIFNVEHFVNSPYKNEAMSRAFK